MAVSLATLDQIAKALELVPVPYVAAAATAADAILTVIETSRNVDLSTERTFLQQVAAAAEPWQTVHARATGGAAASPLVSDGTSPAPASASTSTTE